MFPTLVLLPGMDGTGDLFGPLLAEIRDSIPTVVVRYPSAEPMDYPALTELARESLPTDRPFVILGESFSGPIAINLAAQAPHGLLGLILCASFVSGPRPRLARFAGLLRLVPIRLVADLIGTHRLMGRFETSELRRLLREALAKVSPAVLRARVQAASHVDVSSELKGMNVPILYLQASEDSIVPKSAAEEFARLAASGKVAIVAGPHFLLQCAPQESARVIGEFLTVLQSNC